MAELIRPLDPPQFLVCDDVRIEISGKHTLVGVYPGNTIAVPQFPADLFFSVWTIVIPTVPGSISGAFRIRNEKEAVVFETPAAFNVHVPNAVLPVAMVSDCT